MRRVLAAFVAAVAAAVSFEPAQGLGRPGLTPVACPSQQWAPVDPALEPLPEPKRSPGTIPAAFTKSRSPTSGMVS